MYIGLSGEDGRKLVRKVVNGVGQGMLVVYVLLLVFYFRGWMGKSEALPRWGFMEGYRQQVGLVLQVMMYLAPWGVMAVIVGQPLKMAMGEGSQRIHKRRYITSPREWWMMMPMWPVIGVGVWACWCFVAGAFAQPEMSVGMVLGRSAVMMVMAFVVLGILLTGVEAWLVPEGIRTGTTQLSEWENIEKVEESPRGLVLYDKRTGRYPKSRLTPKSAEVERAVRDALAARGIEVVKGEYRQNPVAILLAYLLMVVGGVVACVSVWKLGVVWGGLVVLGVSSGLTVALDYWRGAMSATWMKPEGGMEEE